MRKLRERITPARWRKFHFRIYVLVVGLLLLYFTLDGSRWNGVPILAALALLLLDLTGGLLFFRFFFAVRPAAAFSGCTGAATAAGAENT